MRLAVVDTETTGMEPAEDRLVELAVVRLDLAPFDQWRTAEEWHTLVNPERPIPPEASAIHHIVARDVVSAPPAPAAWEIMGRVIGEVDLWVAHNAAFDRGFISRLSPELASPSRWIDTWRCSLHLWPEAPSHSNQTLRYWLGRDPSLPSNLYPHRALYDTIVTADILRLMLSMRSVEDLQKMSEEPAVLRKVGFGKHRGMLWRDVPRDYMQWVLRQRDMDADTRHTCLHWLNQPPPARTADPVVADLL